MRKHLILHIYILITLLGCGKQSNDFSQIKLDCGPYDYSGYRAIKLKISDKSEVNPSKIKIFQGENNITSTIEKTEYGCLLFGKKLEGDFSLIYDRSVAARVSDPTSLENFSVLNMRSCGEHCKVFPTCGFFPKQVLSTHDPVDYIHLKKPSGDGYYGDLDVLSIHSVSLREPSRALSSSELGCVAITDNFRGELRIDDAFGNFLEATSDELKKLDSSKGGVKPVSLRKPLTEDEVFCRKNPRSHILDQDRCRLKTFKDYCIEDRSDIGVFAIFRFFVDAGCAEIDKYLKKQKNLNFGEQNLFSEVAALSGLPKLESLDISLNSVGTLERLQGLPSLKELVIRENADQLNLDINSIWRFKNLKSLNIVGSKIAQVKEMPALESLEELSISHKSHLELLKYTPNLKTLYFNGAHEQKVNFNKINNLPKLEKLCISNTTARGGFKTWQVPISLRELDLTTVDFSETDNLPNLKYLKMLRMTRVTPAFPKSGFQSLESLESLKIVSFLGTWVIPELPQLRSLRIDGNAIGSLDHIASYPLLRSLSIDLTEEMTNLDLLPTQPRLEELDLGLKNYLNDLKTIQRFPFLRRLDLGWTYLSALSSLPDLPNLSHLSFNNASDDFEEQGHIAVYQNLAKYTELKTLDIEDDYLADLEIIPELLKLKDLSITISEDFSLKGISKFRDLLTLKVVSYKAPHRLDTEELLPKLRSLKLSSMVGVLSPANIPKMPNLVELSTPLSIEGLTSRDLSKLKTLSIGDISDLNILNGFPLESLSISNALSNTLEGMPLLEKLTSLSIDSESITSLKGIDKLPNLKSLIVTGMGYNDISDIKNLTNLDSLSLGYDVLPNSLSFLEGMALSDFSAFHRIKNQLSGSCPTNENTAQVVTDFCEIYYKNPAQRIMGPVMP